MGRIVDCMFAYVYIHMYLQGLCSFGLSWKTLECIVDCVFVFIFAVFVLFWRVLEDLGIHSGLHVCIRIYGLCALLARPGRPWNA